MNAVLGHDDELSPDIIVTITSRKQQSKLKEAMFKKISFVAAICGVAILASCSGNNKRNQDSAIADSEVIAVATDTVVDTNGNVVEEGVVMEAEAGATVDTNGNTTTGK